MSTGNKFKLEATLIAAVCVVLFVGALVGTSTVGKRYAERKTEELLGYACQDLPNTLRGNFYSSAQLESEKIVGRMSAKNPLLSAEVRKLLDGCAFDEIYLVSHHGKVLAAADPAIVGKDLTTIPSMIDFLSLVETPNLVIEQPIRLSIADAKTEVSYCGFPQEDGSLLLCGFNVGRLQRNFVRSGADLLSTWAIGESGTYAVVNDATGKLVFDVRNGAKAGDRFDATCDPAALTDDFDIDTTHVGTFFGKRCHYRVYNCYGLRTVAFIEHDEFFSQVNVMVLTVAFVLFLTFLAFGAVFRRVMLANRAIARLREAEDKQRLKDMVMATSIQKHSLPTNFPPYPNLVDIFDIYAFMQTAKEVGGDFYDFYFVGKNKVALVVADVSGKGVPAAMFMMRAKTTLQGFLKTGRDLVEAMVETNNHLCEGNSDDIFVTAWVGVCDLATGKVEYVNAGHNPPIIRRTDGSLEWIRPRSGLVMAAMEGTTYRSHELTLAPGDGIVLYTDGVTEAQNPAGALYGEDRFERVTAATDVAVDARTYCDSVLTSLEQFAEGAEQADDITMLAFRLKKFRAAED